MLRPLDLRGDPYRSGVAATTRRIVQLPEDVGTSAAPQVLLDAVHRAEVLGEGVEVGQHADREGPAPPTPRRWPRSVAWRAVQPPYPYVGSHTRRSSPASGPARCSRWRRPGHRTLRHCLACRTPGHDGRPAAPGTQRRWPAPGHRRLPRSRARERLRPRGRRGERACRKPLRHVQVHDDDIREHVVDASMNDDLPVGLEYRELVSQRGVVRDHHDPGSLRRHPRACRRGRGRGANLVVEQRANRRRIDWGPSRSGRCGCFSTDGSDSNTSSRGWRTGGLSSNSSSSLEASSSRTKTRRSASSRPARWTLRVTPAP
jgi:hypothetical protein